MDDRHLFGLKKDKKPSTIENIVTGVTVGLLIYFTVLWFGIDLGKEVPVHSEISNMHICLTFFKLFYNIFLFITNRIFC